MKRELPDIQAGFRKGRGIRDLIANIHWIIEKARKFQGNIYFRFTDYVKPLTVWITTKWENPTRGGSTGPPTYLLRNLYAGQEARVRARQETMDWFKIGKGVPQGCMLSPGLFYFQAEYIMQNAGLDEAQAEIKIARRNNLRYAADTTLMEESQEEQRAR